MADKKVWALGQAADQLDSGHRWNNPETLTIINATTGTTTKTQVITYSMTGIPRQDPVDDITAQAFVAPNAAEQIKITEAFELWDDLIKPELRASSSPEANITFNYHCLNDNPHASPEYNNNGSLRREEVWIPNVSSTVSNGKTVTVDYHNIQYGNHVFSTFVHEIGHTLGLDHSGNYNASTMRDEDITYEKVGSHAQDTIQYTIMSYFKPDWYAGGGGNFWKDGIVNGQLIEPQTPMLHDVAAIQAMYGADMGTRTGNTVYGFNSLFPTEGVGAVYNFNVNKLPVMTIYDAGGNDTLDVSGFSMKQSIDLRAGAFSSIGGLKNNVSMAFNETSGPNGHPNLNPNAVIENAVGGSGEDSMWGNSANNILTGGASADTIYGLDGRDTLDGGTGADSMYGGRGDDTYIVDNAGDRVSEIDFLRMEARPNPYAPWTVQYVPVYGDMGGTDEIKTSLSQFSLYNAQYIENLTYTGSGSFTGMGNELDNVLTGGANVDTLSGGKGRDTLYGGGGRDVLEGNEGNDALYGGEGPDFMKGGGDDDHYWYVEKDDVIMEGASEGRDRVVTQVSGYVLGENLEELQVGNQLTDGVMVGTGNGLDNYIGAWDVHTGPSGKGFEFYGKGGKDTLGGSNAALGDLLDGGDGDDYLYGNGGNDTLRGGEGADLHFGGEDFDTADYSQAKAGIVVDLVSGGTGGEAHGDTYIAVEAVKGSQFADTIFGTSNADTFTGLGGSDTIDGRGGDDTVVLSGKRSDYKIALNGKSATVVDLRAGSPDGTDTIVNIEHVQFADRTVDFAKLDDPGSVSISDVTIAEGNNGSQFATFTVTRTGGSAAFDVKFATSDGIATTVDGDYAAKSGSVHFGDGVETQKITVEIKGDTKIEGIETVNVTLSGASNGAAITDAVGIATITNDDVAAAPKAPEPVAAATDDFSGDGKTDILFQNTNGKVALWQMDGSKIASNTTVGSAARSWHIEGTDDFNGDGKTDILWRHDNGSVAMWKMDGDEIAANTTVGSAGTHWQIAGVDDFGGDGKADVLWTSGDGQVAMWKMDGDQIASNTTVGTIGKGWKVEATGDFNGDGKADLLLQNGNQVAMWTMNGDKVTDVKTFGTVGNGFHFAAAGDLNGDGKADILWQSDSGQVAMWKMDGSKIVANQIVGSAPAGWDIAQIADFNRDGQVDVLAHNSSGQVAIAQIDGHQVTSLHSVGSVSTDWNMMN